MITFHGQAMIFCNYLARWFVPVLYLSTCQKSQPSIFTVCCLPAYLLLMMVILDKSDNM